MQCEHPHTGVDKVAQGVAFIYSWMTTYERAAVELNMSLDMESIL